MIAMTTMLIDHLAAFYWRYDPQFLHPFFTIGHRQVTAYFLLRCIGRIAFPIFAFLIVEGFQHTSNRRKYGLSLFVFALISELPWNYIHSGTWHYHSQNVLFTLLLGFLGLCALERFRHDGRRLAASLIGLLVVSVLLRCDYGCSGYGMILLLYVLRRQRLLQAVIGSCVLSSRWIAGLAFIPINMYNGERGFIRGPFAKYIFYAFYPVHLIIIYWIRCMG